MFAKFAILRPAMTSARYLSFALAIAASAALPALAQTYPTKPVRYIVPFPAGGSPDIIARLITERFGKMWGHQVIVDNRPGAGGTVGAGVAAKLAADGYNLFQCNIASSAIAPALYAKLPYDHQRDFAPISRIGTTPNVLVVHPAFPARSMKEFMAYAKANPGKLSYGTSAPGNSQQLTMELIKLTTKIDVVFIPYKGAPQSLSDTIGGQIPCTLQSAPGVIAAIRAGRVRPLAVTSAKRIPQLPDVPTMSETVLPNFDVNSWYGLCAPTGTPAPILEKVHTDLTTVLRMPEIQERLNELVVQVAPTSPQEFGQFIRAETERWAKVIKAANIPQEGG